MIAGSTCDTINLLMFFYRHDRHLWGSTQQKRLRRNHMTRQWDSWIIELDYGKIYRKALYLMVKTMVSCKFSLKPIQWMKSCCFARFWAIRILGHQLLKGCRDWPMSFFFPDDLMRLRVHSRRLRGGKQMEVRVTTPSQEAFSSLDIFKGCQSLQEHSSNLWHWNPYIWL